MKDEAQGRDFRLLEGGVATPRGFQAGGIHCGLKENLLDLGMIYSDVPAAASAVYTTNAFQAAPLAITRESLHHEPSLQAVVVNSGYANACTGKPGEDDARSMRAHSAEHWGLNPDDVAVASTGVIGQRMPLPKVLSGIERLVPQVDMDGGDAFAESILTTDTLMKTVCVQVEIDGKLVTIGGAAKGSGMIHPNMATMLGFITTDAAVEPDLLDTMLKDATNETYNMITVDGDTSTNDMVLTLANGVAENRPLNASHPELDRFYQAFLFVQRTLAKAIARDGEGATKLIEVRVQHAPELDQARQIAKSVIGSNLVKSAVYGTDANWGRIVCAMGYSGQPLDPDKADVFIGPIQVVRKGLPEAFDEKSALQYLQEDTIEIRIDLHSGDAEAVGWGCDLTYEYVRINACYRT